MLKVLGSRSGIIGRRLRYPNPWLAPARWKRLDVFRDVGLGDVLMCTPALRELKRVNPDCRVRFHTNYRSLVEGLPYIDEIVDCGTESTEVIQLLYEEVIPPRRHIAKIFGDCLGVRVTDVRPDCMVRPELVDAFAERWRGLPRPYVVVNRNAGPWTPNKDWPDASWCDLITRLCAWGTVVEIGSKPRSSNEWGERYVDLRSQCTLDELVAVMAAADLHVGPISGPVHIAAAFRKPAVVIYGGYEHPVCSSYPLNISLFSSLPCSPCWLREPCPFELKCLHMISPSEVETAVRTLWQRSQPTS